MLTIKTTPNLQGISLQGDHNDLNSLYDALARYLEFYQENAKDYSYYEYEYLLSLNYDIRHAYMGTREYTVVDNNALYYSVNILYPLVFHYLISFERILDEYYLSSWFENTEKNEDNPFSYDEIQVNHDRALIKSLTALIWDNIYELFGRETALDAYNYFSSQEFGFTPSIYIDALLHHQGVHFNRLTVEGRKAYLYLSLMEIMDTEELLSHRKANRSCYTQYRKALSLLSGKDADGVVFLKTDTKPFPLKKRKFPTQEVFFREFHKKLGEKDQLYEDDFDQFLNDAYGVMDDEYDVEW